MIYEFAMKISKTLEMNNLIKDEDIDFYRYGLELIIITILKGAGLLILAAIIGIVKETIVFIIFFTSLRVQAGGVHSQSVWKCFVITCLMTFSAIYISKLIPQDYEKIYQYFMMIFALMGIWLFAPMDTPNRRLNAKEKKKYRKRSIATIIIACFVIISIGLLGSNYQIYATIAVTAIAFEGVTLIPINIKKSNFKEVF
ncbi:accessory gene regulator ArgB-like protein [Alkaliphilus peptidifermentans]|uniref:Accessory gene regulator B n=1 Tax=Alkaliphilus peptidifermentans DSM 18978 TaxID=1120976 RepID=A0A1G5GG99_9FIRM|nr:accessory gene regulator B family protein [Alkaliphilus peptidifermentans]SCY50596.1 accessory gene regulator B [Alkaliphilus peptidifermentans DSM 18978]